MKSRLKLLLCLWVVLIAMFSICTSGAIAQKSIKLKYALTHGAPGLSPMGDVSEAWQKIVTSRTKGAITFENFWGGALGAPAEHIEFMKNGVTDAGIIFGWYTPAKLPFSNFEYVFPFGPIDYELVIKAKKQICDEIPQFYKEMADQNVMVISILPQTTYNFLSKDPLRTVDDFKGKKVGLIGRYFGRWLPPGAIPVVRPGHERYDMLKTGVTSVDLNPLENQFLFKLDEVTQYSLRGIPVLTLTDIPICMNINSFKKLPPAYQKIVLEAGKELEIRAGKEILPNWEKKILNEFKKKGIKFIDFPVKEQQKWLNSLEDIPAEWAAEMESKGLPGWKAVQRYQEITAELGYKWPRRWGLKK